MSSAGWPSGSASRCTPGTCRSGEGAAAHLAGDLALVARCAEEVRAYAGPADSRNAFVLGMVQRAWSLIERGATAESMTEIMAAFGDWIELSPDGGNLVMLFHGQPHDLRVRAAADLPRLLAELPKDKEWLPNLHGVSGGLLESDLGGEPAALVHAELAPYAPPLPRRRHRRGPRGLGGAPPRQPRHARR